MTDHNELPPSTQATLAKLQQTRAQLLSNQRNATEQLLDLRQQMQALHSLLGDIEDTLLNVDAAIKKESI